MMFGLSGPLLYVSIALAASLAGNAVLGHFYLEQRDETATAVASGNQARNAAQQCSDGVLSLQSAAEARAAAAEAARDASDLARTAAERRAQNLLSKRPSVPADDCRSAAVQMDDWLTTRGAK